MRPVQIITISITPKIFGDQAMIRALDRLVTEDPAIRVASADSKTGRVTIAGVGEVHLEAIVDRLRREFGVEGAISRPAAFLKNAISETAVGEIKSAKAVRGKRQYAHVKLELSPRDHGEGYSFENRLLAGTLPERFVSAIEHGIETARTIGHPFDDVRVELLDASFHDVDSSEVAFRIAAGDAFHHAVSRAKPAVVEPVMRVEAAVAQTHADKVLQILHERKARIVEQYDRDTMRTIVARVRVERMFGLGGDLVHTIEHAGTYSIRFERYEPIRDDLDLDDGKDRDSLVGAPRKPLTPGRGSAIALPEPEQEDDGDDDEWRLPRG